MVDPLTWSVSNDGKYRYVRYLHQPARADIDMSSGAPYYGGATDMPISVQEELTRLASLYYRADLVRVTYDMFPPTNFRMIGSTIGLNDPALEGYYYSRIDNKSFRFFACPLHEYPGGTKSDSSNTIGLAPQNFLGMTSIPTLNPPDKTDDAVGVSGDEKFEKLFEDRRIRILQGLRKRRFVWRPKTRFDKMYRRFQIDRVNDAQNALSNYDDDQRVGGMWFAIDQSTFSSTSNWTSEENQNVMPIVMRVKFAFKLSGRT